MSRKALVVVGLAAVIAASTSVAFASNGGRHVRGVDGDPVSATVSSDDADVSDSSESGVYSDPEIVASDYSGTVAYSADVSSDFETGASEPSAVEDSDNSVGSFNVLPVSSFGILRVVDRDSGEEQSPRVVFGKSFNSCFLTLYNNSSLEICLNPSTGIAESGTYSIYGDIMYVFFGDDREAQYEVAFSDDGNIDYIIVPSGNYDIYFG